jgi:preprotein translocase subunit SecD
MLEFPTWKKVGIWLVILAGLLFAAPNVIPKDLLAKVPAWLPSKTLNLGLDLQGGSHILLEVDTSEVVKHRLETIEDSIRGELRDLRNAKNQRVGYADFKQGEDFVSFQLRDPADMDRVVEAMRGLSQPIGGAISGGLTGDRDIDVSSQDGTLVVLRLTEAGITDRKRLTVQQSIEIVRRRIDELGTREPTIIREGQDRIVVQVPGLQDPNQLKAILGQTASMSFHMVDLAATEEDLARGRAPAGSIILPMAEDETQKIAVRRRADVSGEQLIDAQPTFQEGQPVVTLQFDTAGGRKFADITTNNVGKPFAIVLDGKVISAPRINSPILGGSGIIEGGFTVETANNLAVLLRAGALPAPLTVLEERTVGPDLGADSINAGQIAAVIGTLAVVFFMFITYGRFGLYANLVLIINVVLILAVMSMMQATLTLPGIAGLVLTIGTAVDANVLIFERIREELRSGRTVMSAVDAGYREASRAIWDANITNLIAAALMFMFGSGPIKGFAVVLTIGIVTSVFTGVTVCRMFTVGWLKKARPAKLIL